MGRGYERAIPVVHGGVRYEAPHWSDLIEYPERAKQPPIDEPLLRRVTAAMQRDAMARMRAMFSNLDEEADVDPASPEGLAKTLRAAGSFSEDEIARASAMMEAMLGPEPIYPVRGGYIRALDDATGRELWRLMIYENGEGDGSSSNREDVVVTSLAFEGEHLVARDAEPHPSRRSPGPPGHRVLRRHHANAARSRAGCTPSVTGPVARDCSS